MIITYSAQILLLIGRYIEAKVIDDYGDVWIGMALGVTVYGKGGSGSLRACKVLSLEG